MYLPFYLGSGSYFRSCRSAVNINNSRLDVIFQTQGCNGRISFERLNPKPSYSRYQCQIIFTTTTLLVLRADLVYCEPLPPTGISLGLNFPQLCGRIWPRFLKTPSFTSTSKPALAPSRCDLRPLIPLHDHASSSNCAY